MFLNQAKFYFNYIWIKIWGLRFFFFFLVEKLTLSVCVFKMLFLVYRISFLGVEWIFSCKIVSEESEVWGQELCTSLDDIGRLFLVPVTEKKSYHSFCITANTNTERKNKQTKKNHHTQKPNGWLKCLLWINSSILKQMNTCPPQKIHEKMLLFKAYEAPSVNLRNRTTEHTLTLPPLPMDC